MSDYPKFLTGKRKGQSKSRRKHVLGLSLIVASIVAVLVCAVWAMGFRILGPALLGLVIAGALILGAVLYVDNDPNWPS